MFIGMVYWQLRDSPFGISSWAFSQHFLKFVCVLPIIAFGYPIISIPLVWTAVLSMLGIFGCIKLKRFVALTRGNNLDEISTFKLIFSSFPFSSSRTLEYADIQLPVILGMGILGSSASGLIAASLVFIQGVLLLPISIFQRLYRGRFHDWAVSDPLKLRQVTRLGGIWMFCIGLVIALGLNLTSRDLLTFVFGSEFSDADLFLSAVSLSLPMWFAAIPFNAALVSARHAKVRVWLQLTSIVIVILGSILLVPSQGMQGIGWSVCVSQSILLVGAWITLYSS